MQMHLLQELACIDPQTAWERQDLSCTYLAHDELESVIIIISAITIDTITIIISMHRFKCVDLLVLFSCRWRWWRWGQF